MQRRGWTTVTPDSRLVLQRTWLIKPEHDPGGGVRPTLTGLYGYPWPEPALNARCLHVDPVRGAYPLGTSGVGRHHPVVPEPSCSCGIYADRRLGWSRNPSPHPRAVGFVELGARILVNGNRYRAGWGRIVGPLAIVLPHRRWWPTGPFPVVRTMTDRYRLVRSGSGPAPEAWRRQIASALERRYGVQVVALDERATRRAPA